jgi:hypothetical protein
VRKDLGAANVTAMQSSFGSGEGTPTSYVVGGYSAGVAFRIGLRFEPVAGARGAGSTAASEADAKQPG